MPFASGRVSNPILPMMVRKKDSFEDMRSIDQYLTFKADQRGLWAPYEIAAEGNEPA